MQANNGPPLKPAVIVRAWGDEPVKLFLHRIENRRCYVGKLESHTPIGLPDDQVFIFDQQFFNRVTEISWANFGRTYPWTILLAIGIKMI